MLLVKTRTVSVYNKVEQGKLILLLHIYWGDDFEQNERNACRSA